MDRILVIDTDSHFRTVLESSLTSGGFHVETAPTLAQASKLAKENSYHLVLTASELADADALSVIHWAQREQQAAAVVIVVPLDGVNWPKPAVLLSDGIMFRSAAGIDDPQRPVLQALKLRRALYERDLLRKDRNANHLDAVLQPVDPAGKQLAAQLLGMAAQATPVLLTGESGSQFELLALEIHRNSAAQGGPFLSLVGQAGRADPVDHELFGIEEPRVDMGRLEGAHGGTLFIEEIAQLPIPIQDKLLRYLETGAFFRRGGSRKVISGTRLIVASCRDLAASVESGGFRSDLYHLLMQYRIAVPPLRARRLDIISLAEQILSKAAERLGRPTLQLTPDAARTLENYSWPGNLQELACVMERVALLSENPVRVSNLMPDPTLLRTDASWRDIERQAIEDALRANGGNRTKAAKQLGMSLRKLQYRLNEYGIRRR